MLSFLLFSVFSTLVFCYSRVLVVLSFLFIVGQVLPGQRGMEYTFHGDIEEGDCFRCFVSHPMLAGEQLPYCRSRDVEDLHDNLRICSLVCVCENPSALLGNPVFFIWYEF